MARRTITVRVDGQERDVEAPRVRRGGQPLMPTRTIASGRDKSRRRQPKHRHRQDGEW